MRYPNSGTRRRSISLLAIVATVLALTTRPAHAQLSVGEAAIAAKTAFDDAKALYDLYKSGQAFFSPQPTTADLIAAAVRDIENLVTGTAAAQQYAAARTAIEEYQTAVASGLPSGSLAQFDRDAQAALNGLEALIGSNVDVRYAHALGPVYNALLAIYLEVHLMGPSWGSTTPQARLEMDFITRARTGLQLDYDMVGAKLVGGVNTTSGSQLGRWVLLASAGGAIATTDSLAASYFQTDQAVQGIQRAAAALFSILQRTAVDPSLLQGTGGSSVRVDVSGWTDNWRGYPDAIWTSIQPYVFSSNPIGIRPCPPDFGMVSVWQLPVAGFAGFLCSPLLGTPTATAVTSYVRSVVNGTCSSSGFCSELTTCSSTDIASSLTFGLAQCVHRLEPGLEIMPARGPDAPVFKHFDVLPPAGAFYDLPPQFVLTGFDPTDYPHRNFTYIIASVYPAMMTYTPLLNLPMML